MKVIYVLIVKAYLSSKFENSLNSLIVNPSNEKMHTTKI